MAKARQQYFADEVTLQKENRDFAIQPELVEKLESIEAWAQVNVIETVKVNWEALIPDENKAVDVSVPLVEDTLYSTDPDKALSANQWKVLYDYIQNLASRGRYLSNWNTVTWLPSTNPVDNPYQYRAWDYYVVSNVAAEGGTNYRPNGNSYSWGVASTTVETETVKVWDYYTYDWQHWLLLVNTAREIAVDSSLSTTSTNPVENRVITNALNTKQNNISDLETIRSWAALWATALQPWAGLSELTWTSDDITQWTTNLFMTTAERSKLSNQSWVNTWDETQTTIKNKLWQASTSTDGYLTSTDWNTFNNKQWTISDLETIRSNASAWKNASDTIAIYWDIVTHDADEFATASQGWKADTAIQPWDNVSELTNDAWYITDAYHDSTKQDKLIAWANIQIAADWKTISATDTTYVAWDFDIKDLADSTGLRAEWSWKQDELIAWTNIQIAADWKTISATDTKYTAWVNVSISNNNVISATDSKAEWWNISWTLSDQTDLNTALGWKQDTLIAWANIQIASDGKTISATDTTYTAGPWIDITNWVISNTQTSAEWWNITWTLSDQTDLQTALDAKQDDMVILSYGNSTWNDFITAYNKNWVVYCRASSNSNPATWSQTRLAFMAYVNNETSPTEVEFQYYRSRSNHDSAANQLDEVYVYKLVPANGWTWTVTQRNTAAKATAWTWINLTYGSGNMTIANTWVTSINSQTWDVTLTIPTVPTNVSDFVNDAWYITANDLPTIDASMSDSSTNAVQNNVIKNYVDTQVQEATSGAVSDTAYWTSWNWITGIAPSKNAVYDKISAMDTTIAWKQNTISDLSTIRSWAALWATALQSGDNISELTNDAGFITKAVSDLTNYYTKSETYTKSEVADYVANFAWFKVVATLPTTDIKTTIIYLLWPVWTWADKYEEYIYSNNTWVKIWETSVDLTNYFNTSTDNSDSITQGSTNLFLTTAERTKLSNTSGTNTGDETKTTIQSKLGAATSSNDWYLTSADWTTFNNKADATDINTKTFYLSSTSDLTNAQAALDWLLAWKNAILFYNGQPYTYTWTREYGSVYSFYSKIDISKNASQSGITWNISTIKWTWLALRVSNQQVTSISNYNADFLGSYLDVSVNYSTPYTPQYDWSPATKKYVDDWLSWKQSTLTTQTAYTSKGSATKVPQITTNSLWQVTWITEVDITHPSQVSDDYYYSSWDWVTTIAPSKNAVYDKISDMDSIISGKASAADVNTKTFTILDTTDTATLQDAIDWYMAGKMPLVKWRANTFILSSFQFTYDWQLNAHATFTQISTVSSGDLIRYKLNIDCTGTTISTVTETQETLISNTAYASSWDGVTGIAPTKDAVYDKISAMDTTIDGKLDKITWTSSLDRAYIVNTSWTQTSYNVSQWASNGAIVRRSWTQIIVPETPTDNTHAASKKYVDDAVAQAWGWDMNYSDFNWQAKTWATITLDLASTYTPSADFTVNAPATIKDWQTYILRVNNESTAYTMTLWTNVTNPFGTDITLTDYWIDQFVFLAIWGNLELQPEWWGWGWAITADTTWTETSISKIWVWTEAEYANLWTYEENVAYMTY